MLQSLMYTQKQKVICYLVRILHALKFGQKPGKEEKYQKALTGFEHTREEDIYRVTIKERPP